MKSQLTSKFGFEKADYLFQQMFGSANPTTPTNFDQFQKVQEEVLNKLSSALLAEQMGQD